MTPMQQQKLNLWMMRILLIHLLFLFGLSYGLSAVPHQALEWAIYHILVEDLHIITQSGFSPYPFVSVITSVYAFCSGIFVFILFLCLLKHLEPSRSLSFLLQSRFADQLKLGEDLKFTQLLKGILMCAFGVLMIIFHLFLLNDNNYGSKGGAYPAAFNSRFGIFIAQSFMSFWTFGMLLLCTLWIQHLKLYYQQRFKA